jgi:hypothetical protein
MARGAYGLDGSRVLGGPKRDAISKGVTPLTLLLHWLSHLAHVVLIPDTHTISPISQN